ncbi:MAG: nucleotidyltransferase domain-containing protein [Erysipelotrichaceae bacterium]|nr:nucleotidyltransferase domain-containing protein [Erysipelotrichaceae bacterium]
MTLLQIRNKYQISQALAASSVGVPLRTYIRYENNNDYGNSLKRESMIQKLMNKYEITEDKGMLSIETIKNELTSLFDSEYKGKIEFCYLFGSYAKGYAKDNSDVDLCVSTSLTGLRFAGLSEAIRTVLHKRIDLIRFNNLENNLELVCEIMKDGIKIYG